MKTDLTRTVSLADIVGNAPKIFTEPVDPKRTALIIIDMQGDANKPIPEDIQSTIAGCEKLLNAARKSGIKVIHVILGSWTLDGSDLEESKKRMNRLAISLGQDPIAKRSWDSPSRQIYPQLTPIKGEIVLKKTSSSAFPTTGLAAILHNMNIKYTVFAGKLTDGCLGLTAADAHSHGFLVTLADGACKATCETAQLVIFRLFDQHWGRVRTVNEIIKEFEQAK